MIGLAIFLLMIGVCWLGVRHFKGAYSKEQQEWPKGLKAPWHSRDSMATQAPDFPKRLRHEASLPLYR